MANRQQNLAWTEGEVILADYVIEGRLGQGGMGTVYLVRSGSSGQRFAVKKTHLRDEASQRNFLTELRTWIDLPEHPHLAACRFFRTVGDEVVIFAEYVDGGSLETWIQQRKLTRLEQVLDVAIQFAWGLHAAHELGLVHQDAKPGNVLMARDGVAKVTDFGLARAREMAGESSGEPGQSILVSVGGMTPAYCSPEQFAGRRLSRRTDIWSWGVSLLEMFTGEVTWQAGPDAPRELDKYLARESEDPSVPALPASVADLLRKCLQEKPAERWANMAEAADVLRRVYRQVTGEDYPRPEPAGWHRAGAPAVVHDRRTTWGVQWGDPRQWLRQALREEGRDPVRAEARLPSRLGSRKAQAIADLAIYEEARSIYERLVAGGRKDLEPELARLCIHKAYVHHNAEDRPGALALCDRAVAIRERLLEREGRTEQANELARAYLSKAIAVSDLGDNHAAVALYDRAIALYERLVEREGRTEWANDLAWAYLNKAIAVSALGDNHAAVALSDRGIALRERLVECEGQTELQGDLAWAVSLRAKALLDLGEHQRAATEARAALAVLEAEIARTGRVDLQQVLNWARTAFQEVL